MSTIAIESGTCVTPSLPVIANSENLAIAGSILLPVDGGSETQVAAEHLARTVSGNSAAHVHLLHVTPFIHKHIGRYLPKKAKEGFIAERAASSVEPVRRLLELAGVKTTVHVSSSQDIAGEVLAVAEREQCARIVMGATRKSPLLRIATNSVTGRVLAGATIPVEVIAGRDAPLWQRIGIPAGIGLAMAALLIELD